MVIDLFVVRVSVSFSVSLLCALVLFTIWFFLGQPLLFVLFFNQTVGFLIVATVLYTKIGKHVHVQTSSLVHLSLCL